MSVAIKICGITGMADALAAVEAGADYIGLNFYAASPRCVDLDRACEIAKAVAGRATPTGTSVAGIFVDMDAAEVLRIARRFPLDAVQLHGGESAEYCRRISAEFAVMRAVRVDTEFDVARLGDFADCAGILLDTPCAGHGGSGVSFNWNGVDWKGVRAAAAGAKLFLAGGLDASNVAEAIAIAQPDVVDVCSGVEAAKGIKSVEKMREFVAAVRAAERAA